MWYAKNTYGYTRDSVEAIANGQEVLSVLTAKGWTVNAISAFWGNVGFEGGYNPWRWEGDVVVASTDTTSIDDADRIHGYGLVQFTPPKKYLWSQLAQADTDFSPHYSDIVGNPHDGASQCRFISDYAGTTGDYFINPYYNFPLTYSDFKTSTQTPEYLAACWLHNYERPADQSTSVEVVRGREARYWYDLWGGTPPTPTQSHKWKYWLYLRRR